MVKPKLTIGMAHHNDFDGAYFTIRKIRQTNKRLKEIEFVVVNNSIGTTHAEYLKNFVTNHCGNGTAGAQFIDYDVYGTTQPRNKVFEVANGEFVLCVDCHIELEPFAADRLIKFLEQNPQTNDLYQGPMLGDHDEIYATHFDDVWRDQMWGIWATDPRGLLSPNLEALPVIDRVEHTRYMKQFEIPAMGLGLFGCRKEAWLGFNPNFRGFGGEEWYIHEKYRKHGHKCWCLPWLRWGHRFGRVSGIGYTLTVEHKVVNYMYGCKELGTSLDRVYEHFVTAKIIPQSTWDNLLKLVEAGQVMQPAGPPPTMRRQGQAVAEPNPQAILPQGGVHNAPPASVDMSRAQPPDGVTNLDEVFEWCRLIPRDINEHLPTLKKWAGKVDHVTEFTGRRESTVGLIAGRPVTFISYSTENDLLTSPFGALHKLAGPDEAIHMFKTKLGGDSLVEEIEETDLLFLDTEHNAERLSKELDRHAGKVRRAIIIHDTHSFGEKGDNGGPGLMHAIRPWLEAHSEWFPAEHHTNQYGLTVLSKFEEDRPTGKIHLWPPGFGPGTELKAILKTAGIAESPTCDCNAKAIQMDIWGAVACRDEHRDAIIAWLRDGETRWGWKDKWSAGAMLLTKDPLLAIRINPADPYPGLVDAAIRRALKDEKKLAKES